MAKGWDVKVEGNKAVIKVPDGAILLPAEPGTTARKLRMPMRKLVYKLQVKIAEKTGTHPTQWKFSGGIRGTRDYPISTFDFYRDNN